MPVKSALGVYTRLPDALSVTTPPATATPTPPTPIATPLTWVTVSALPSTSLSLARTLIVTGVSSAVVKLSLVATGASSTAANAPLTVALDVAPDASATV